MLPLMSNLFLPKWNWAFTVRSLKYIPHKFSSDEAAKRFCEHDKNRLFAPIQFEQQEGLVVHVNPLKKVLLPIFGINANIKKTEFEGRYGIDRIDTYFDHKGKMHTRTRTDWYPISGVLDPQMYSQQESNMSIYGGLSWDSSPVEQAMEGFENLDDLQNFDPKAIDSETVVDPFLKRSAVAQEIGNERIESVERQRATSYIEKKIWCNHTSIHKINIVFDQFKLSSQLLPAYVLQYNEAPPRIMQAFDHNVKIIGPAPVSMAKLMSLSGATATAISLLFPQAAITTRVLMIVASSLTGGLWAKFRLSLENYFQQRRVIQDAQYNESVSESKADKKRRAESGAAPLAIPLDIEPKYYDIIGLQTDQPITEEAVREAFNKKIQDVHPDHNPNGSPQEAKDLIQARQVMLDALRNKKKEVGKRYYSTAAVRQPPRSTYHPQAKKLIDTVLIEKDYKKALQLVEEEEVPPDSHDKGENTLLVTLVKDKRGTLKDINFVIDELNTSLDASCDCPAHRTALHYAATQGNYDKVKLLIDKGANPNLITSFGETALDLAIQNGHHKVKEYIEIHGGVQHKTLSGNEGLWKKITGYSSEERTILIKDNDTKQLPKK